MYYQRADTEVIDYGLVNLAGVDLRGPVPEPLVPGSYFACVGAAQTFGRFCPEPYPALLARRLGLPALNLGVGGAGPRFFLDRPALLEHAQRARFVVVQVLSGRSASNSAFASPGKQTLVRRADGAELDSPDAWAELLETRDRPELARLIAETRADWLASFRALLRSLRAPTVLLWLSTRAPAYRESYDTVRGLLGTFPQLVNRESVEAVRSLSDGYVECVTARGLPQALSSRFTGAPAAVASRLSKPEPAPINSYYPSPKMHEEAARALAPACAAYLRGRLPGR